MLFNRLQKYNLDFDSGVVLAPDVGSAKMSQAYAKKLGLGFALIDKRRPTHNVAKVVNLIGDLNNKNVFIIDDMIDTAGTICNAAVTAMENGANSVIAIATHPVLSGEAINRLEASPINKVIVSDTISMLDEKIFDKLEIISVSDIFAETIKRINSGESVSSLFK